VERARSARADAARAVDQAALAREQARAAVANARAARATYCRRAG
jgi:hypothetical protein